MLLIFHIPNWFTDPLIGSWFISQLLCKVQGVNARMMKQKGCGRQQMWLILTYYYIIYVEVLRKTMPNHSDQSPVWNMNHITTRYKSVLILTLWPLPAVLCCAVPSWLHTAPCQYWYRYTAMTIHVPTWWTDSSKLKRGCQWCTLWPSTHFTTVFFTFQNVTQFHGTRVKVIPLMPLREAQPSLYAYLTQQISYKSTTRVESAGSN